jgi:MFS family permease
MFFGWKIVAVAFAIAFFGFGVGFYGLGVYLVALNARHRWPISFISSAITVYYVLEASLTAFIGDAFERFGPRTVVTVAVCALGLGTLALPQVQHPWQLYVAFAVMALGWAGVSGAAINLLVAPWFERKRGLAASIAMNGAAAGGMLVVPLWTVLIARAGFASAAFIVVSGMILILLPLIVRYLHRGPEHIGLRPDGAGALETLASEDQGRAQAGTTPAPRRSPRRPGAELFLTSLGFRHTFPYAS